MRRKHFAALCLTGLIAALAGCTSMGADEARSSSEEAPAGVLQLAITVGDAEVDLVHYEISARDIRPSIEGLLPLTDEGIAEGFLQGVPAGEDRQLVVWAEVDGQRVCYGSTTFDVVPNVTVAVHMPLHCDLDGDRGAVDIEVEVNRVPVIHAVLALPAEVLPGEPLVLSVAASDPDGANLRYEWRGRGEFADPSSPQTVWSSESSGRSVINIVVTDPEGGLAFGSVEVNVISLVVCGDGEVQEGEECDDGNTEDGDGCDASCALESREMITGLATFTGSIPAEGGDTFPFTVDDESQFRAETLGENGCQVGGDTILELYRVFDEERELIAMDDDGGEGLCSRLEMMLDVGRYEVRVVGFGGRPVAEYRLELRLEVPIDGGGQFDGTYVVRGNDLYSFGLAADAEVELETAPGNVEAPRGDTMMSLYRIDDDGRMHIATNDDGGAGLYSRIATVLPAGRYELEVHGFDGTAHSGYVLNVRLEGAEPPPPIDCEGACMMADACQVIPMEACMGICIDMAENDPPAAQTLTTCIGTHLPEGECDEEGFFNCLEEPPPPPPPPPPPFPPELCEDLCVALVECEIEESSVENCTASCVRQIDRNSELYWRQYGCAEDTLMSGTCDVRGYAMCVENQPPPPPPPPPSEECQFLCSTFVECEFGFPMDECLMSCEAQFERDPESIWMQVECAAETLTAGQCDGDAFIMCVEGEPPPPPPPPTVEACEWACDAIAECGHVSNTCVDDCSRGFEADPEQAQREVDCILEFMGDGLCDIGRTEACLMEQP